MDDREKRYWFRKTFPMIIMPCGYQLSCGFGQIEEVIKAETLWCKLGCNKCTHRKAMKKLIKFYKYSGDTEGKEIVREWDNGKTYYIGAED